MLQPARATSTVISGQGQAYPEAGIKEVAAHAGEQDEEDGAPGGEARLDVHAQRGEQQRVGGKGPKAVKDHEGGEPAPPLLRLGQLWRIPAQQDGLCQGSYEPSHFTDG